MLVYQHHEWRSIADKTLSQSKQHAKKCGTESVADKKERKLLRYSANFVHDFRGKQFLQLKTLTSPSSTETNLCEPTHFLFLTVGSRSKCNSTTTIIIKALWASYALKKNAAREKNCFIRATTTFSQVTQFLLVCIFSCQKPSRTFMPNTNAFSDHYNKKRPTLHCKAYVDKRTHKKTATVQKLPQALMINYRDPVPLIYTVNAT